MALPIWVILVLQCLTSTAPASVRVDREAWVMGTRLTIAIEAPQRQEAEEASELVLAEIERLEGVLSTWNPVTELSRANSARPGLRFETTSELTSLLIEAESWARATARAFDPTVGALVDAWDLRGAGKTPGPDELATALDATGPDAFVVDRPDNWIVRRSPGSWIDAGGFGKGAALRSSAVLLRNLGVERALVDLGGQFWAAAPAESPWVLDVAHPARRGDPVARLRVHDVSVATSGASERPGHILDPRTGQPVPAWGSVTVATSDPFEADVLATALYVMGPEAGMAWVRTHTDAAVLFLVDGSHGIEATWNAAMERWLVESPRMDGSNPTLLPLIR